MIENIKSLFDFTKLPTKFYFLFAVISGYLLIVDNKAIEILKLHKFIEKFGEFFGIIFLSSSGLVIVNFIIWAIGRLSTTYNNILARRNVNSQIRYTLVNLDPNEKAVLREFYINNQKTILMPVNNPVVAGLINQGILAYASRNGRIRISKCNRVQDKFFPLTLSPEVRTKVNNILIGLNEDSSLDTFNRPLWASIQYRI